MHDDSANSGSFGQCSDLMGDQLVPDDLLGTEHIVVAGYLSPHDRLQILATEDNTTITVDGGFVATLQEGQAHEYVLAAPSAFIQSTSPVAIWQTTGFGCEFGGALLPHVECTGSKSAVFVRSTSEAMRFHLIVPAGGENDFLFNGQPGPLSPTNISYFPVPGNPDWMFAQVTTLEGQMPVGQPTRIENTTSEFHMGIINGGGNSGTRYVYITDYGALKNGTDNQSVNLCIGDPLVMAVDSVENGLYQWAGPNDFEFSGFVVDLGESELSDAGLYVVQGYDGECPIQNDTISVTFLSEGCTDSYACNFSTEAECDDGSCDYSCCPGPGCCTEGMYWDWELSGCYNINPADINLDGCVQLNDLLDLLSAYGDCGAEESTWQCGEPLEYQGYDYETVQIGEQCWFAENLRSENYENGDAIPSNVSDSEWSSTTSGAVALYGEDAGC